jgi:hypothetical protein
MNQISIQKWFLLQNITDSSLNPNGVFITENGHNTVMLAVWSSFGKNFQI